MNGLDLFSGIGGIAEALSPWVETRAYCENEPHAQAELLSRMSRGEIHTAPIWDDITTLKAKDLPPIEIISAGFPCQDISVAGRRAGLGGERSGLFFEVVRLAREIRPEFIFLENTPGIFVPPVKKKKQPAPLGIVASEMAALGYDCRWSVLSAFDVGAPHLRERWWCLARRKDVDDSQGGRRRVRDADDNRTSKGALNPLGNPSEGVAHSNSRQRVDQEKEIQAGRLAINHGRGSLADTDGFRRGVRGSERKGIRRGKQARDEIDTGCKDVAKPERMRKLQSKGVKQNKRRRASNGSEDVANTTSKRQENFQRSSASTERGGRRATCGSSWWPIEPAVGRVAHGVPLRGNRVMRLGLTVVPKCAREAFKRLMGL